MSDKEITARIDFKKINKLLKKDENLEKKPIEKIEKNNENELLKNENYKPREEKNVENIKMKIFQKMVKNIGFMMKN